MEKYVGRSNFMLKYYKNYKEELDSINEESKKFKPKKWWAYALFYCYLVFLCLDIIYEYFLIA